MGQEHHQLPLPDKRLRPAAAWLRRLPESQAGAGIRYRRQPAFLTI